ncbi:MAG: hemolysin family protein [Alphaproteobacteria bacterium]|nr:hemolysin family protein [Alphaproteobacteria bacterium]
MLPHLSPSLIVAIAFLCVMLNAFFVIAEHSLLTFKFSTIDELETEKDKKSKLILKMVDNTNKYIEAAQCGISFSSLILGGITGIAFLQHLVHVIDFPHIGPVYDAVLGLGLIFVSMAFFHIIFGELLPKMFALKQEGKPFSFVVRPFYIFTLVFKPILAVLDFITKLCAKVMGSKVSDFDDDTNFINDDEIKSIAGASQRSGLIDKTESEIIRNAVDFSDKTAREIMVPRQEMECLFLENSYQENFDLVKQTNFTRYPVCDEDKDNVVGMVHLRDMLMNTDKKNIKEMLREILFIPENMSMSDVLHTMKTKRIHLAIVTDEYGGTSGLISLEDVLEELVGDIQDEHDGNEEAEMVKKDDGSFEFLDSTLLDEAAEFMNLRVDSESAEETIGAYIFKLLAKKPQIGDTVESPQCFFEILDVDGFRVKKIRAIVKEEENLDEYQAQEEEIERSLQ